MRTLHFAAVHQSVVVKVFGCRRSPEVLQTPAAAYESLHGTGRRKRRRARRMIMRPAAAWPLYSLGAKLLPP